MKTTLIGIGFIVLVIASAVTYVIMKERKIRQLEDELAVVESQAKTDTLIFDSTSVVVFVDSAKVKQQAKRIKRLRDMLLKCAETLSDSTVDIVIVDSLFDDVLNEPCNKILEFDSLVVWGMNRVTFEISVDCGKETAEMTFGKYFGQPKQKRFGIGLFTGAGIGYNRKPDILVGIGLTYRIKSF